MPRTGFEQACSETEVSNRLRTGGAVGRGWGSSRLSSDETFSTFVLHLGTFVYICNVCLHLFTFVTVCLHLFTFVTVLFTFIYICNRFSRWFPFLRLLAFPKPATPAESRSTSQMSAEMRATPLPVDPSVETAHSKESDVDHNLRASLPPFLPYTGTSPMHLETGKVGGETTAFFKGGRVFRVDSFPNPYSS